VAGWGGGAMWVAVGGGAPPAAEAGADARLALLDLAMPALHDLPEEPAGRFRRTAQQLIREDGNVRMFDYALVHILARHLQPGRDRAAGVSEQIHSFQPLQREVELVLSALAHAGAQSPPEVEAAFRAAAARLPEAVVEAMALRPAEQIDLARVDAALQRLERSAMGVRRRFLDACAHCVAFDGQVLPAEAEALRAVAEALDCPLPPIAAATRSAVTA
jgi:hypothetical protein